MTAFRFDAELGLYDPRELGLSEPKSGGLWAFFHRLVVVVGGVFR